MTWTSVNGAKMMTSVLPRINVNETRWLHVHLGPDNVVELTYGELPTAPIMPNCISFLRMLIATASAAVVSVMLMTRKS